MRTSAAVFRVLLAAGLSLAGFATSGCVCAPPPAHARAAPPPPPPPPPYQPPPPPSNGVGTTATHEAPDGPPPPPANPPPPAHHANALDCNDADRIALQYAADHRLGEMHVQNCERIEGGHVFRVFLKGPRHGPKDHLKVRIDARDGRLLEAKEEHEARGSHDHENGHGHEHGGHH